MPHLGLQHRHGIFLASSRTIAPSVSRSKANSELDGEWITSSTDRSLPTSLFVASRWQAISGRASALHAWLWQLWNRRAENWLAPLGSLAAEVLSGFPGRETEFKQGRRQLNWQTQAQAIEQAKRIVVLWLQPKSNTLRALLESLERRVDPPLVWIPTESSLISPTLQTQLVERGARLLSVHRQSINVEGLLSKSNIKSVGAQLPKTSSWSWLTHATRASDRVRPGESRVDFFRRIWQGPAWALGDELSTLASILSMRRIVARSGAVRGSIPMVSWSAVALAERTNQVSYRASRAHWDSAHCGIAISRRLASRRKTRPVSYGTEADYLAMSEDERSWFQPRGSKGIDWSREQEWRSVGDFELLRDETDDWFAYAPTDAAAEALRVLTGVDVVSLEQVQRSGRWPFE